MNPIARTKGLNSNAKAMATFEIVKTFASYAGNFDHRSPDCRKAFGVVENCALRMGSTPQPACERIRVSMDYVNMNQIV